MAYSTLSREDVVLSSEAVATPMWSNGSSELTNFFSSSAQIMGLSGDYYIDIYSENPNPGNSNNATVEYACTFADKYGRHASPYDSQVPENTPTRTIFGQYRSLVLGDEESDFYFNGASEPSSSYFWVINVDRARYKEHLMSGTTFAISLGSGSGELILVDNSTVQGSSRYIDSGQVFNIVEGTGSAATGYYPKGTTKSYGYFLPDIGTILLDGQSLIDKHVTNISSSLAASTNMEQDVQSFIQAVRSFSLQSKETVTSNYIFIRVKNSEFNYSMNPSNITSTGELRHKVMINSPEAYITTIGLYNSNNDLVAVAKLSRPLPKNFTKEALFRIKLDY